MRRFSHPHQPQNQQSFDRPIYSQQQHSENASSYVEPLNGGTAPGIYHNGTWYNTQPQYAYQPLDNGQHSPQMLQSNFESPQIYSYQPQDTPLPTAVPQPYPSSYQAMEPPQPANQQPYNYQPYQHQQQHQQHRQQQQVQPQQQHVQPQQLIASPHNPATFYNQPYPQQSYQPLPTASQPQFATAPVTSTGQAAAIPVATLPVAGPALPALPALPAPQQRSPYTYSTYRYNQELPQSAASGQTLLQTHDTLPSVAPSVAALPPAAPPKAEPFGYQYNYQYPCELPQNPQLAAPMPQPAAPSIPLAVPMHATSESLEPQIIEIDISSATDVFITRTREKLVISIYKQRGGGKGDQPQNVYINGGVPGDVVQPEIPPKANLNQEPTTSQNGRAATPARQQIEAPVVETVPEVKEPPAPVVCKQELPKAPVLSPQHGTELSVPGFKAFNVIDPSTLMECSPPKFRPSKQEHLISNCCTTETEKKSSLCPNRETSVVEAVEQFRAPRRVVQTFNQLPIRDKSCKMEENLPKNSNAIRSMRSMNQPKFEMPVRDITKPPPKLTAQEKSVKRVPENCNFLPSRWQENADDQQREKLVQVGSKIKEQAKAEISLPEPKACTWKRGSQETVATDWVSQLIAQESLAIAQLALENPNTTQRTSQECLKADNPKETPKTPRKLARVSAQTGGNRLTNQPIIALPIEGRPKEILEIHNNTAHVQYPSAQEKSNLVLAICQPSAQVMPKKSQQSEGTQGTVKQLTKEKQEETQVPIQAAYSSPTSKFSKKKAKVLARQNQRETQSNADSPQQTSSNVAQDNQSNQLGFSADVKPGNLSHQTDFKGTQQIDPKILQQETFSPSKSSAQEKFEKVSPETTSALPRQLIFQPKAQVAASTMQFIPKKGANSIVLGPSKPIKAIAKERPEPAKLMAPERIERVEYQAKQQAKVLPATERTNPSVEQKNEVELTEAKLLTSLSQEASSLLPLALQSHLVTIKKPLTNEVKVAAEGPAQVEPDLNDQKSSEEVLPPATPVKSKRQKTNSPAPVKVAASDEADVVRPPKKSAVPQAGKSVPKVKRVKLEDLMFSAFSKAEEPIQPFGNASNAKKKPTKLSKLERKVLRRETNKAQSELQAAQKAEAMEKKTGEQIKDGENNGKKKNDIGQADETNAGSNSEAEPDCPALKDVCDPVLRRRLMIIINKIVNL